jgi:hypothetical protein
MKKEMDQAMLEPSDETVENILNHAKQGAAVRS